ncbi:MAG: SpoIIE family protein phosphatase [Planctomycetota bacterium]
MLLILFMTFLATSIYNEALARLDNEINDKGIALVQLCATSTEPFWTDASLSRDALQSAQERLERRLQDFGSNPGAKGVLDIVILERGATQVSGGAEKEAFIAAASGSGSMGIDISTPVESTQAAAAGVQVFGGRLDGEPVRAYECSISSAGQEVGSVTLFLSSALIEQLRDKIQNSAITTTLVALLVGILVVVLIGSLLTRPVRVLRHDMSMVAMGDLQHKSSVRSGDELEQLAHSFNRMTTHLAEAQEQEASRKALERELNIATKIQTGLLPEEVPQIPGYQLFPYYASAKEVGGDYYDIVEIAPNRYAIVVADVSGKGIPGSLVMTMTRSLMRMAVRESRTPEEIMQRVNASLSADMKRGMFVTCIYVDFNAATGEIAVARAGHNPAYLYRSAAASTESLTPPGIALGIDMGTIFDQVLQAHSFQLDVGDFLVLYTDGVIEAMDPDGNEYTPERFMAIFEEHSAQPAREIVREVLADVNRHTKGGEASDDITLLVLKREPTNGQR